MSMLGIMGNLVYRPCPIRIYNSEERSGPFYDYGANQITGWRRKQEDRYVCLPKFHEDLSLFAVYDGHGGEQVVQYLQRYLHQYIRSELKLFRDPEMSLYLGYMNCDRSMRSITQAELDVINEDLNKEFELNESHDRRKVIREFAGRYPTYSAEASKNEPNPDEDSSTSKPADSSSKPSTGSFFNQIPDAMKDEIMDKVLEELPRMTNSIFYLTKAPLAKENDDSDESFEPDDDERKSIFESSDNGSEESTGNESDESAASEDEESVENEQAEQTGDDEEMKTRDDEEMKTRDDEEMKSGVDEEMKSGVDEKMKTRDDEEMKTRDDEEMKTGVDEKMKTGVDEKMKTGDDEKMKTGDDEKMKTGDDEKMKTGDDEKMKTGDDEKMKTGNEEEMKTGNEEEMNKNERNSETGNNSGCHEMDISDELPDNKESAAEQKERKVKKVKSAKRKRKPLIGQDCGSTATVLLLSKEKLHIANVGDSRCVACINGEAVDLSVDHRPTDKEEKIRIINGGGNVSEEGRVNDILDMSRAFGDFEFKSEDIEAPYQVLSSEPHVITIDVTSDLEFIVVASDGIWNTMDSSDVIEYIKKRMQDSEMELRDIIAELFEEMLPSQVTEDGSGCDNMTAIIITFSGDGNSNKGIGHDLYVYAYPPEQEQMETKTAPAVCQQHQIQEDSLQLSDVADGHEETAEEYSRNEENMEEMLEPIPACPNEALASTPGCHNSANFQAPTVRNNSNINHFLGQLYLTLEFVEQKIESAKHEMTALINNKCNQLRGITNHIREILETELPHCNDLNYFNYRNSFLSSIHRLDLLKQDAATSIYDNRVNETPSASFSSTPVYISEDTHASTSYIYPNTTASLDTHPSTSRIHQSHIIPDTPASPDPPVSPSQIPRVSLSRLEKRLLYASNPQSNHEVIDLTEGERNSSVTNGDNRAASEPEHVQVTKRAAEEPDEVSKKLKTDDYAISNTEKHK